jgi:hypothetical protein
MTPEAKARQPIDAMLVASGWVIQDDKAFKSGSGVPPLIESARAETALPL